MDLRKITERIPDHVPDNVVFTFEKGQAVRRTFADAYEDIMTTQVRLADWGVRAGMRVGIRSPNCYHWMIHDLALIGLGAVSVAFTDDFSKRKPEDLCRQYDLALFLAGANERAGRNAFRSVAYVEGENRDTQVVEGAPRADDAEYERPGLIFSSGSSGGLKGLILNRKGVEACVDAFTQRVVPRSDDRLLLFLPMSNFQQRLMYYSAFWYGYDLIVIEAVHLFRALSELAPTIVIAPPAFYEVFENRFHNLAPAKRRLAMLLGQLARAIPVEAVRTSLGRLIFRQAHQALGGNIRLLITGMAPIKRSTLDLFSVMQLPLFETYGLIESGSVSLNLPGENRRGSVGRLLPGVSVDFAPDGEILVRREHPIAVGYFQCAEGESERTFLPGVVATGDIGRFDEDRYLYLIGRKKEIIVTSGGEKVHPEVIEAEINACPDVDRAVVFGRQCGPTLAAIILAKKPDDLIAQARIEKFIEQLNHGRRNIDVGRVVFTEIVFSRENGFLRPNLKLNRNRIGEHFLDEIEQDGSTG